MTFRAGAATEQGENVGPVNKHAGPGSRSLRACRADGVNRSSHISENHRNRDVEKHELGCAE